MQELNEVLQIKKGVTAFVGGGGKTRSILQVVCELSALNYRIIITTTTKMYRLTPEEAEVVLYGKTLGEILEQLKTVDSQIQKIAVGTMEKEGKMIGIEPEWVKELQHYADYILVEADGSRQLPIKAPGALEPVIPKCANHVVAVVGWSGIGQVIKVCSFRSDCVSEILNKKEDMLLEDEDVIRLILHEEGLLKGVENREYSVLINQVDTKEDEEKVRRLYQKNTTAINQQNVKRVVIGALKYRQWSSLQQIEE